MCGIIGFFNRTIENPSLGLSVLKGMNRAMKVQKHRGPDDDGCVSFTYNGIVNESHSPEELYGRQFDGVFGFNRLSIKDLSMAGHQPMLSKDKKVILVFNGEIYNDDELRKMLQNKGYLFVSNTDTEVILNLYLEFGFEKMLKQLNGMFSIAIMDLRNNRCYMARDRFGIKPIYYTIDDNFIIFASELKCFVQFEEFEKELDIDAFNARIVFSRPSSKVLLKHVELINPGEMISVDLQNGNTYSNQYFNLNDYIRDGSKYKNIEEAIKELDILLTDTLKRQMISDVKVGCQVSGGIDSSIVSYYANKVKGKSLEDGVSIIDDCKKGEEEFIDSVGNTLDINLHKITLNVDDFINNYENLVWYNDAPLYKPYFTSFYVMMKEAKQYVTVLMSGEGADEISGGYNRFAAGILQPFVKKISGENGLKIKTYETYAEYAVNSDSTITNGVYSYGYDISKLIKEQIEIFNSFTGTDFTKQLKYETFSRLPESFLRQDKMSMANSIENRVPLVDNVISDFIMTLPENMLLKFVSDSPVDLTDNPFEWAQGKHILKEICAKIFGHEFAYRKKEIMAFDEKKMLSEPGFVKYFFDSIYPGMKKRGLIDAEIIKDWFENINDLSVTEFNNMWRVIGLETWCQLFLDKDYCHE